MRYAINRTPPETANALIQTEQTNIKKCSLLKRESAQCRYVNSIGVVRVLLAKLNVSGVYGRRKRLQL